MSAEAAMEQQPPGCMDGTQTILQSSRLRFGLLICILSVRTRESYYVRTVHCCCITAAPGFTHPRLMRSEDWAHMQTLRGSGTAPLGMPGHYEESRARPILGESVHE